MRARSCARGVRERRLEGPPRDQRGRKEGTTSKLFEGCEQDPRAAWHGGWRSGWGVGVGEGGGVGGEMGRAGLMKGVVVCAERTGCVRPLPPQAAPTTPAGRRGELDVRQSRRRSARGRRGVRD